MSEEIYNLPSFLEGKVEKDKYKKWLDSTARRQRDKDKKIFTKESYKIVIHKAVYESGGRDYYTNENLDWHLISKWTSEKGAKRKGFEMLPTVDHFDPASKDLDFKICAWITNDMKNDMTYKDLLERCKKVLENKR